MAYIAPNSTIEIFGDVSLAPEQDDTLYFASVGAKDSYFSGLNKLATFSAQSYQRRDRGYIRVEATMAQLYTACYMRYKNTSFENKWFYAFITGVEYVNNITVEIRFQIDVMMTWMGAFSLSQCFIERQHQTVDYPGSNIVDEGLDTGEYMTEAVIKTGFTGIQGTEDPAHPMMLRNCAVCIACTTDMNGASISGGAYAGIYSGCQYHYFDTINAANNFIDTLVQAGKTEGLITISLVPKNYVPTLNDSAMHSWGTNSQNKPYTSINGWTGFKNKKLLTYPYKSLLVTNMEGEFAEYRYEFFDGNTFGFKCNGVSTINAEFIITPINYKSQQEDITDNMIMSNFPVVSWNVDTFKAWYAQNKTSLWTSLYNQASTGVMNTALGAFKLAPTLASGGALGDLGSLSGTGNLMGAKSNLDNITNKLAEVKDYMRKPPTFGGQIGQDIMVSLGAKDFYYIEKSITREYAKMIDDYFTMFGYAVKEVATPNMNARPYFTYVKTIDCVVHGNLPAEDAGIIEAMFDKGVRFWKNHTQIGNYSLNNAPT